MISLSSLLHRGRASAAALALLACAAAAQTPLPGRPITLVVPYPPGGSADILARMVGERLGHQLGQTVVVENKAGAGTAIGAKAVADAAPDGHTLLLGTVSSQAINPAMTKVGYDPLRNFATVSPLASIPFVLVANPAAPMRSVAEVIAQAKAMPGAVGYASAGPGTSNHLAGELLASAAGVKLLHVPYRGSAPALADVLAGHVPLMFDLQSTAVPNIRTGKLKAIAVTGTQRSALLPEVPTVGESGLPGYEVSAWFGIFAPAGLPAPVLDKLGAAFAAILRTPEMEKRLRDLGAEPDTRSREAFDSYVRSEVSRYAGVVRSAGLAP
ncbi:tripartite tricarboxylate transporter substrate binding protein [Variovorax terrae]|uniref:Tripartite tricarboxylate transporter substrate binding protein n=1 Tax=Variovorax terrae TaxID=2923278 RepID=A0A9X1VWL6_9BURK|nr:tripartite tricarboxylate transporter substrate binding protein [Variovorax terrae]MCJ0765151.1 tripartite tricarboxylate transporter substrate binding protein [Variovorax terrae]